jgi:hypothetical protein
MKSLSALALLVATQSVIARVGETETQIEARYGKKVFDLPTEFGTARGYAHAGMAIAVTFLDGRSVEEIYHKDSDAVFSENEIAVFAKFNGGDRFVWNQEESDNPDRIVWRRSAGLVMVYSRSKRALCICTEEFWKETGRHFNGKEATKLKDL